MISAKTSIGRDVVFGADCTVWQYATICNDVTLGKGVVIGSNVWIGKGCKIGDYTRIQHGAFIPNYTLVGRSVFVGPNATLCDDKYPKVGKLYKPEPPILEDDCSIGAAAVLLPGVRIGRGATVGAGAVVTQDIPQFSTAIGVPAVARP
jgi:UDP-2-acetamido-3-amino-2,3-dideoxy-glucuronate N-acetyltransferase